MKKSKSPSNAFAEIVEGFPESTLVVSIGLYHLYRPEITRERSVFGEWTTLRTQSAHPALVLRFDDEGEMAASSAMQFGDIEGEVSIPALLSYLYRHGQEVIAKNEDEFGDEYSRIMDVVFENFPLEDFMNVTVDFTEMSHNAMLILSGPGNAVLKEQLAEAEAALIANGTKIDPFFMNEATDLSGPYLNNETVLRMERLLQHCRDLIPRDPDNAVSHYMHNLATIITTGQPPEAIQLASAKLK